MLKLKRGQVVKSITSNSAYYVVEVSEYLIYLNTAADYSGQLLTFTNERFKGSFIYEELFEPKMCDTVYVLDTVNMKVICKAHNPENKYNLNKIFQTEAKAEECLNKIKAII
jgi:hypothetical protein